MTTFSGPTRHEGMPDEILVSPVRSGEQHIFWVRFPDREVQEKFTGYLTWKDIITVDPDVLPDFLRFACRIHTPVCFEPL